MTKEGFAEFLKDQYPQKKSGTANSYINAVAILDRIFALSDVFDLNGISLCALNDLSKLIEIEEFVRHEEYRFRKNDEGIFTLGRSGQKSYPMKGFCSAAMKSLINYYGSCQQDAARQLVKATMSGNMISKQLVKFFDINDKSGEDVVRETKTRIGQEFFRKMLLENYQGKCSITGLDVPQVLRASHIVAWKDDKINRLNPENGILLSATYDAAFDQHLISFDEQYRMIISKEIKDYYTSNVAKDYFINKEGFQMTLPTKFPPNQILLQKHRELLVG